MRQIKLTRGDLIKENTELKNSLKLRHIQACAGITRQAIPWGSLIIILCFGFYELAINIMPDIAGKTTAFKFNFSISFSFYISLTLTGLSIFYAYREHRAKEEEIKKLAERLKDCHNKFDSYRGTSGLTPEGNTNKEDI